VIIENPIFTHPRVYAYFDRNGVFSMLDSVARCSFIRRVQTNTLMWAKH